MGAEHRKFGESAAGASMHCLSGFLLAAVCFHVATQGVAFELSDNCKWFVFLCNIYILIPGIFLLGCRLLTMYNPRDQTIGKASVFSKLIDNIVGQMD